MKRLLIVLFCTVTFGVAAQQGVVRGRVADARTGENIEYATVALLSPKDSTLKGGTVTDGSGHFRLEAPYGRYLLRITFVGYEPQYHKNTVTLSAEHPSLNLGKLSINPQATMMEAVEVSAERSMVEYQLDKRVVNVDKNIVAGGGTASDVLEQVPSVAIDNDGNVTLRGSGNVKVLVNGRPSELLASDLATLLEQIPASTVENVEVITIPSAKYDPEGMSGIINIKLKDKTAGALGLNGVVNLNAGAPLPFMIPKDKPQFIPTVMGNVSLNYTTEKYNLFLNMDGGVRQRGNKSHTDIEYLDANGNPRSHYDIDQFSINPNYMGSVKVGGEYYFDDQNSLLLSYQLRGGNRRRNSDITAVDVLHSNDSLHYDQKGTGDNRNINNSFNLLYTKKFDRKDEELTFDATFSTRKVVGDGMQEQIYHDALAQAANYYRRDSETKNHHQALNLKLNWLRPLDSFFGKEGWRLETGYEGRMDWPNQKADYYRSTSTTNHVHDSISSTHFDYRQHVHAVYGTLG
ncbi:MAG: TonB-dependent receptor, partial [Bacteroidales bacterium]|nr:TonB-dependent receptor [Bacteroidales bacterium]